MKRLIAFLSLFSSISTLLCCALPALLVLLGLGATLAGFISAVPPITALSEHKGLTFGVAIGFLFIGWTARYFSAKQELQCLPDNPSACATTRDSSFYILAFSTILFIVAVIVAFVLPEFI